MKQTAILNSEGVHIPTFLCVRCDATNLTSVRSVCDMFPDVEDDNDKKYVVECIKCEKQHIFNIRSER